MFSNQAWLKLNFFTGNRASDLLLVVAQEVKCQADGLGLVFNRTFKKTLRGDENKSNSFVIKRCSDLVVCRVKGLLDFIEISKLHSADLSKGYLFRPVAEFGRVLDKNVSYLVIIMRG